MSKTYPKLDFWQRERVWELHRAGWAGARIAAMLAEGDASHDPPIAPAKMTPQALNSVIRTMKLERDRLYSTKLAHIPTEDTLALLRRKISLTANAEADRLAERQRAGKLDPDQLRKLAGACERIERMEVSAAKREAVPDPPRKPRGQDGDQGEEQKPPTFAESMLAKADTDDGDPAAQSGTGPLAVPSDPTDQNTGIGQGAS